MRDGDRVLSLGGPKRRAVLALLLLEANRTVAVGRLVDGLWGDSPPSAAQASLQNHVSRLRRVLGDRIETIPPGYRLRVAPDELDLHRFRRLVAEAQAGDPPTRGALLRGALALWHGSPLADLADEPAGGAAAHLDELRLAALEDRIDADLASGRHAELVPELETLVAEHPYRERLRGQLILALYRAGRQADALHAYAIARRVLVEELGAEPGPDLQAVHRAILRHDPAAASPADAAPLPAAPPVPEERKRVTVLLADVLPADAPADPEARRELLAARWSEAARAVEEHGGTAERAAEGRLLGIFGVPSVHDDDALRAVRASFALVEAKLASRAALATGEVVTGDPAAGRQLVSGTPLEQAERLRADAAGGEIRATERTWRLVRHAVVAESRDGGHLLRSVDPAAPPLSRRLETPFVGRNDELAEILRPLDRAIADRRPGLVTVFGAPGIGKSRIAAECAFRLPDARAVVAHCPAYGQDTTYAPLRELVATLAPGDVRAGLATVLTDEPEAEAVVRGILAAVGDGGETAPVEEIAWAVRRLLEAVARAQPLLLVVDDIHWAAPVFLDLLESVVLLTRVPVLLLCLARPDLLDVRPGWGGGRLSSTTVLLDALSDDASEALLAGLESDAPLRHGERDRILAVAEGNPLFLEQLVATALEGESTVPDSIHALLAARLDRLGEADRAVAQAAAVCGTAFAAAAVSDLVGRDVTPSLRALAERELLRPIDPGALGETWAFAHALIRDEAYESIPKRRRAELHERLARRAEAHGDEADEVVGYHLEQAVRSRRDVGETGTALAVMGAEAARRLGAAGMRAFERNDMSAAASLLERAVALSGDTHERDALAPQLAEALHSIGDRPAARAVLAEARASAERRGDEHDLARNTLAIDLNELWSDDPPPLEQVFDDLERIVPLLRDAGDHEGLALAELLRFHVLDRGRGPEPERHLRLALDEARRAGSRFLEAAILSWICIALPRGTVPVGEAIRYVREIVDTAPNRYARASALGALGLLRAMEGALDEARALVEEDRMILVDLGLRQAAAAHSIAIAEVELMAGDDEAAIGILREGLDRLAEVGDEHSTANAAWRLALALAHVGRDDEAEKLARVAAETTPRGFWVDVWWRVALARAEARRGRGEEAVRLIREAGGLMARIPATGMQADAELEAAQALRDAGRAAEAESLLRSAEAIAERLGYVVAARRARELLSGR